ncbi:Uma2 family endonuclease [Trichothermofontia sichuanensis B231]|uniref:Uma2 family endonuclease n=1 Tax=Trichothermofontia sichuanensis TaxID=3045816 RepID=UPI002245CF74|nr:Uma2 family endonuclease [Trichothermofontia sichuanensis]UZQ55109.1 Uma2 family endonuclease [Trichothermofontia sichuanensis B231]
MIVSPSIASPTQPLTLAEYLALPEGETGYELIDGQIIAKMSPKRFHSRTQKTLLYILDNWCQERGEVGIEWAVTLTRREQDWVPIPDLLYVSCDRLPRDCLEDGPCPVPPELAIEIISPDQNFGTILEKVMNYLAAGVLRVWVVDPRAKSITVFYPDAPPQTFTGERVLTDEVLPDLQLTAQQVFQQAGLLP